MGRLETEEEFRANSDLLELGDSPLDDSEWEDSFEGPIVSEKRLHDLSDKRLKSPMLLMSFSGGKPFQTGRSLIP